MKYAVLDGFKRRGRKIWVTIEISDFGTLKTDEGEEYSKSYAWVELSLINNSFVNIKKRIRVHDIYKLPNELNLNLIDAIVNSSEVYTRALSKINKSNSP